MQTRRQPLFLKMGNIEIILPVPGIEVRDRRRLGRRLYVVNGQRDVWVCPQLVGCDFKLMRIFSTTIFGLRRSSTLIMRCIT